MQVHFLFLLPMAFLLPPGTWAGEIIGGQEAKPHSRPYMAYLDIHRGEETFHCGGFLVAKDFVLTAAHCRGDQITVSLGAHNIRKWELRKQKIHVHHQIPHPDYNRETTRNDIMLLQLETEAKLNPFVSILGLPLLADSVQPLTVCSIAGWGRTSTESDSLPARLREVEVQVMPDDACPSNPAWLYADYDPETMMCVGNPADCRDSALGDSGGPLVCDDKAQGIVSWGHCKAPGVYTKISAFVPWIQDTMENVRDRPRL